MPPLAIAAGAAVIGAGGSIIAANKNSKAIDKSTDASLQANRESIAAQKEALDKQLAAQQNALTQSFGYQSGAFNSSGKLQTDIYNNNVGTLNPFLQTGYAAGNQINALLGLPQQQVYTPKNVAFTPVSVPTLTAPATTGAVGPAPQPNNALSAPPQNQQLIDALRAQNGGR